MDQDTDKPRTDDGEAMWAAHRRPTFPVDAPIFTRHVIIRVDDELSPYLADNDKTYNTRRQDLIDVLNTYIGRIQGEEARYRPRFVPDKSEARAMRDQGRYTPVEFTDTLFFRLKIGESLNLGVRIDAHNEYLTVTLLADRLTRVRNSADAMDAMVSRVLDLLEHLSGGDCAGRCDAEIELLYDEFWSVLSRYMTERGRPIEPAFGIQLSDIRGFVSCAPDFAEPMSRRRKEPRLLELRSARLQDRLDRKIDYDVFHFIKRRPNFFGTLLGFGHDDPSEVNSPANVPISGVLDGAAIYGSTLRPSDARNVERRGFTPLRYFIIYNDNSQSQIARLIRRLHVLAELRIAALMDMSGLRYANRQIRNLTRTIDELPIEKVDAEALKTLSAAFISADKGTADKMCRGGTMYRVERSRYYAKAYTDRLQDLRIVRIEGWQPYDAFMRRNLFMEFEYISQIGDRFAAVWQRLERLGAIVQVNAFREYNASILRSSKATATNTDRVVELSSEISEAQWQLRDLQAIAEPVGWGAFSYYVGAGLAKLVLGGVLLWGVLPAAYEKSGESLIEAACIIGAAIFYKLGVEPWIRAKLKREADDRRPAKAPKSA